MDRRRFVLSLSCLGLASAVGPGLMSKLWAAPVLRDDGLHDQPFFLDSFLDLSDDLAEAQAEGRGLIVLFEQRGCPYCRELHRVNFERPEITDYMTETFAVLQLDLWGAREVTDFDGTSLEERKLAQRWGVNFTPTQVIFPAEGREPAFTMPGYFKPFHHLSALEYVATGAYLDQPFQRFLQDKFADFEARGVNPDVW